MWLLVAYICIGAATAGVVYHDDSKGKGFDMLICMLIWPIAVFLGIGAAIGEAVEKKSKP